MMQPLLLLKQTLEAQYDPGPLLLNGPNVKFTSVGQIIPVTESSSKGMSHLLEVGMSLREGTSLGVGFRLNAKAGERDA